MRNIIFILLILFVSIGCEISNKPNNLIDKKQMENIIFDILILNGINTNSLMNEVEVIGDEFIFERYSIDSLQNIIDSLQLHGHDATAIREGLHLLVSTTTVCSCY